MKIGFIGLGIMGKPMAKNLIKAGYSLMVNNLTPAPVEELVACGAEAGTQREIAEQCDIVMTMVPNSPQVREIMLGEDGVGAHMKEGSIFVDMSSINPVASKEIAAQRHLPQMVQPTEHMARLATLPRTDASKQKPHTRRLLSTGQQMASPNAGNNKKTTKHATHSN